MVQSRISERVQRRILFGTEISEGRRGQWIDDVYLQFPSLERIPGDARQCIRSPCRFKGKTSVRKCDRRQKMDSINNQERDGRHIRNNQRPVRYDRN